MQISKDAWLAVLPSIIAAIMVLVGGLLTYQYGRYNAVTEWKREAYRRPFLPQK